MSFEERLSKKQMNRIIGRKPTAPPTKVHTPKSTYKRKRKYVQDFLVEDENYDTFHMFEKDNDETEYWEQYQKSKKV